MANEIKATFNLTVQNGHFRDQVALGQTSIDQAAIGRGGITQTFTETESDFDQDGVTTEGMVFMRNVEPAGNASLEYGPQVGAGDMEPIGILGPGEWAFFRMKPGVQLRGVAIAVGTASVTCQVDIRIYED